MTRCLTTAALALYLLAAASARADYDEKDIQKIAEAAKAGKKVLEFVGVLPVDKAQLVTFEVGLPGTTNKIIRYVIDLHAQLCFAQFAGSSAATVSVPCAAVKRGYPLFAPLITWVKDGAEPTTAER
jgi:hypothetical protein